MIEVTPTKDNAQGEFDVTVRVGKGHTKHRVTVADDTLHSLAPDADAAELVRASFEFLLEREPKEAIMSRFDLTVIGRYFPEYDDEIGNYLRRG